MQCDMCRSIVTNSTPGILNYSNEGVVRVLWWKQAEVMGICIIFIYIETDRIDVKPVSGIQESSFNCNGEI